MQRFPVAHLDHAGMEIGVLHDHREQLVAERTRAMGALTQAHNPALRDEIGCGPVTAAILIGHTAGAERFSTDAKFARQTETAPIPASSGKTRRHRLHRGGDR